MELARESRRVVKAEDAAFDRAITEGLKTKSVSEESVLKVLHELNGA